MPDIKMESSRISAGKPAFVGLVTAIICVLGPWALALPFSPVPITLGLFAVLLSTCLLKAHLGLLSCLIYLLLGFVGLPVFSGFTGGIGMLLGPTGGYLLGYLCIPLCTLPFRFSRDNTIGHLIPGLSLGIILCHSCGTLWLSFQSGISFREAFLIGSLPYIPFDTAKLILACLFAKTIRKRLIKAGLYEKIIAS